MGHAFPAEGNLFKQAAAAAEERRGVEFRTLLFGQLLAGGGIEKAHLRCVFFGCGTG